MPESTFLWNSQACALSTQPEQGSEGGDPPRGTREVSVKRHRDGIMRWFDSKIANGLIEAINSLVQAAKAKARGYRSLRNLIAITYLIAGKIDLKLAT